MAWSIWAFFISIGVSIISMGMLGAVVYLFASPILLLKFPFMNKWDGDWVWPANILAGIIWSFGFLVAGLVNYLIKEQNLSDWQLKAIYLGVIWLWAVLVWWGILVFSKHKNRL